MAPQSLDIYVAFAPPRQRDGLPFAHWMLLVAISGSNDCTRYHTICSGPPSLYAGNYSVEIQDYRLDGLGTSSKELVGRIREKDWDKVDKSARRIPVQNCQKWVCALLEDLERKGLITEGTGRKYYARTEPGVMQACGMVAQKCTVL